jgi:hypothetical protein
LDLQEEIERELEMLRTKEANIPQTLDNDNFSGYFGEHYTGNRVCGTMNSG